MESDWKLFRKKIIVWQESYMERLNEQYIAILNQEKNASDKFWELDKRIRKDQERPGVLLEMKRSTMFVNILELLEDEVIGESDLNEFSNLLKERIRASRNRR